MRFMNNIKKCNRIYEWYKKEATKSNKLKVFIVSQMDS